MNNAIELIKELRLFLAMFLTGGGLSLLNEDLVMQYVYTYNIHLAALTITGIYVSHFLSERRHKNAGKRLNDYQIQLNKIILENSVSQVKAEVRQAFKDYHEIEVIDFVTTIKYLRGLEQRRKDLGINSYTEEAMSMLLSKIKIGVE